GVLAALPVSYEKAMGIERERKARPAPGPHVGAVGERITTKVTVRFVRGYEGMYGTGVMLFMADEQNSTFKTFSSGKLQDVEDFKEGEWYVRGTVKKHETDTKNDGSAITLLTRVAMQREPFPPAKATKAKKPRPASQGKPIFAFEMGGEARGSIGFGARGITAYNWKCPEGVLFDWSARSTGIDLERGDLVFNGQGLEPRLRRFG